MLIHRAEDRGQADYGWLKARYSFSFADYRNPQRMGVGPLIVINNDVIAAGAGFQPHSHQNMEIITVPLRGLLKHEDSAGNQGLIRPGEIQLMSAGRGITHSEFNASQQDDLELLQIWIKPSQSETVPSYQQKSFDWEHPGLEELVGGEGLRIYQDTKIWYLNCADSTVPVLPPLAKTHQYYLFIINGRLVQGPHVLGPRDAFLLSESQTRLEVQDPATALVFALPKI